jgi:hypothetical protein
MHIYALVQIDERDSESFSWFPLVRFPFGAGMFASANEQEGTDRDGDGAEQVDGSRANPDIPSSSSTGKRRSKAWAHFEEIVHGRAKCKHCGTQLQCETTKGTSVLHNHLKSNNCRTKRAAVEQTPILSRY